MGVPGASDTSQTAAGASAAGAAVTDPPLPPMMPRRHTAIAIAVPLLAMGPSDEPARPHGRRLDGPARVLTAASATGCLTERICRRRPARLRIYDPAPRRGESGRTFRYPCRV